MSSSENALALFEKNPYANLSDSDYVNPREYVNVERDLRNLISSISNPKCDIVSYLLNRDKLAKLSKNEKLSKFLSDVICCAEFWPSAYLLAVLSHTQHGNLDLNVKIPDVEKSMLQCDERVRNMMLKDAIDIAADITANKLMYAEKILRQSKMKELLNYCKCDRCILTQQ